MSFQELKMRLIFVPFWLAKVAKDYGLPHSVFVNKQKLSRYISNSDMESYESSRYSFQDYLQSHLHVRLELNSPFEFSTESDHRLGRKNVQMIEAFEDSMGDSQQRHLLGCACPKGSVIRFITKEVIDEHGEPFIVIMAVLNNELDDVDNNTKTFLESLCGLLYGYNRSLKDLAKQGLLGNFLKRLG